MTIRPLTLLLLGATLSLAACGDKGVDGETGSSDVDTDAGTDSETDDGTDTETDAETDTETDDETDSETDSETDDETDSETDDETDSETDTDTDTDTDSGLDQDDDGDSFSENDGDCDDADATVYPGATEVEGNGIDEDCNGLTLTVDMTCHGVDADEDGNQDAVTAVRVVGPWWSWDPVGGPVMIDNGDSTWSILFEDAPGEAMEYLFSINETPPYEDLIDDAAGGGTCAPITDSASYANRQWNPGDGDVSATYASCDPCGTR